MQTSLDINEIGFNNEFIAKSTLVRPKIIKPSKRYEDSDERPEKPRIISKETIDSLNLPPLSLEMKTLDKSKSTLDVRNKMSPPRRFNLLQQNQNLASVNRTEKKF